jgi:hypothetical protein
LVNVCSACFVQSTVLMFPWQIYVAWRFFSLFSDYCRCIAISEINWLGTCPSFAICLYLIDI